ncbi:hypothetical protein PHLCEN_2v3017 [Hermanssonia centrifuga]|uniref:Uncharacterized protein n=1 Tax=Hermanssonia centrifuga TaxID=98765 RepID=A0A2R6R7A3_9APHY|nr:hypothetical protein PHLCEN_2v3017 [Hermanssonia centrifuga]
MAMHARPIPIDPYNPVGDQEEHLRHPSPFIPIRIPVFTPVVFLNDLIIRIINLGSSVGGSSGRGGTNVANLGRRRALSESVESVEEGGAVSLEPLQSRSNRTPRPPTTRVRMNRGVDRRKID